MCRSDDKQVCAVGGEEHEEDSGSFYDLLYSGDEADEGEESRKKRARVEERPADDEEEELERSGVFDDIPEMEPPISRTCARKP